MALKTYTELAEEYQAAIEALILPGGVQSYSIAGRTVTRADLGTLEMLYMKYRRLAERYESSSGRSGLRSQRAVPND